jgi:hypothetical protein
MMEAERNESDERKQSIFDMAKVSSFISATTKGRGSLRGNGGG